jgi:hypothetical protein
MNRPMYIHVALGSDHDGDDNLYLQVLDENCDMLRIATKAEYRAFCRAKDICLDEAHSYDDVIGFDTRVKMLAEMANSLTDNCKHWDVATIADYAQEMRLEIEAIAKRCAGQ